MKKIRKIIDNKNFLNNQNYIFWEKEKEQILNKFFIEKVHDYFSTGYYIRFVNLLALLLFYLIYFYIKDWYIYTYISEWNIRHDNNISIGFFAFWSMIFIFYFFIFFTREKVRKENNSWNSVNLWGVFYKNITKKSFMKEFFIEDFPHLYNYILIFVVFISPILYLSDNLNYFLKLVITFFVFFLLWFFYYYKKWQSFIFKIKYENIIFFPIYIIFRLFLYLYLFIVRTPIKLYRFIKYKVNTNKLVRFKKLNKYEAENEFYKISLNKRNGLI